MWRYRSRDQGAVRVGETGRDALIEADLRARGGRLGARPLEDLWIGVKSDQLGARLPSLCEQGEGACTAAEVKHLLAWPQIGLV